MKVTYKNNIFVKLKRRGTSFLKKCYQKTKRNVFLQAVACTAREFCKNTSLHGLKYILGDNDASDSYNDSNSVKALKALQKLVTGLIWSCICIGLALFAMTLMKLIYDKYQSTPIITVVDSNNYPIWNVNFPSLTVCNVNKVYAPAAWNITHQLLENGYSNQTITQFLHKLGKLIHPDYLNATFISLYATLEELGYNTETMMFELRQPCDHLIKQCLWLGKVVRCEHLFRTSRSSEGFCCSFNYKASKQFLETDNNTNALEQVNAPILRVSGYGPFVGLSITLQPEVDHYITDTKFPGTMIFVHGPFEYPDTKVSYLLGLPATDVNIAVVPHVVESSNEIRNLPLEKRKCYFENEQKLQVSGKYSFQGCMIDCIVEHIVEYCKCIPFYYPHSNIFASLRVPTVDVVDVNDTLFGMDCKCWPSCSEDIYEVETTIFQRSKSSKLRNTILGLAMEEVKHLMSNSNKFQLIFSKSFDPENTTTLKIHFKDMSCIKYRRELYLTWDGVFAAFGGIFSLCWGGSIISFFEFLYYWTFEFVERILQKKKEQFEEKQRYRNFVGISKDAKFKPILQRKRNFDINSDSTATYFN